MLDDEIREVLSRELGAPVSLVPLSRDGKSSVFRASAGGRDYFVKYPDDSTRIHAVLKVANGCRFLPPSPFAEPYRFKDGFLDCHAWCASDTVPPERWNDRQLKSFADAYDEFSAVLQRTESFGEQEDDGEFFSTIRDYAARHRLAARMIRPLLEIPAEERTYGSGDRLSVIHGDLHSANYGFLGDAFAYFYDVDNVLRGFPADDLAYTVLDRAQRLSTSRAAFGRCAEILRYLISRFGGSPREWRVAVNRKRIRQAASKILRRPESVLPALAIRSRDARAVELMKAAGLLGSGRER